MHKRPITSWALLATGFAALAQLTVASCSSDPGGSGEGDDTSSSGTPTTSVTGSGGHTGSSTSTSSSPTSTSGGPTSTSSGPTTSSGGGGSVPCNGKGVDTTTYDYSDNVAPSKMPPGGLAVSDAPMLVSVGFDDNEYSGLPNTNGTGGVQWVIDKLLTKKHQSGDPVRFSFYMATTYGATWYSESGVYVTRAWHSLLAKGQAIENHTVSHATSYSTTADQWDMEVGNASSFLTLAYMDGDPNSPGMYGVGVDPSHIYGFRTPFLQYNDSLFEKLKAHKVWYDCSIEEGWDADDGTGFTWPYTLDDGSPGNKLVAGMGPDLIGSHPGLWELPPYAVIVPPDDVAAQYGVPAGLRNKLSSKGLDPASGKVTGLDYNMWYQLGMTKDEVVATLKYTLDQRLKGNRAPLLFGAHSGEYNSKWVGDPANNPSGPVSASLADRQAAIEEFLDYALSKPEVRVRTGKEVVDWMRDPRPLSCL
jgi:hypothetical protein